MNRGSALKLIEAIESGKYQPGSGQLRFDDCYCAFGVMLDFADPSGWKIHPLHGWEWRGEVFKMPEEVRKRCKMKTVYGDFITSNGRQMCLSDVSSSNWEQPLYYLKNYYEQM